MSSNDNHNTDSKPVSNRARRILVRVSRTLAISYVAILAILVVFETYFVFPGSYRDDPILETDPFFRIVSYQSGETSIHGYLHEHDAAKQTILFFHGNHSRACENQARAKRLANAFDANVLIAEYRGYGDDDHTPSESGIIADGLAAHHFLCKRLALKPNQLIIYGQSMGGGCAVAIASRHGARLLILDRTFDSAANVGADKYPVFPVRLLMRNSFDSIRRIQSYHDPLIQFHGNVDRVIPIRRGKRLFDQTPTANKRWIEFPRLSHNDALSSNQLTEIVANALMLCRQEP